MSVRTKTTQIFCFPTFIVTLKGQWPSQLSFFRQSNNCPRSLKQIAFLFHLGAGLGVSPNDFLEPYWNLLTQSVLVVDCDKLNMKYSKVMSRWPRWHRRGGVQMPFRISKKNNKSAVQSETSEELSVSERSLVPFRNQTDKNMGKP